jgi:hypothetical protein
MVNVLVKLLSNENSVSKILKVSFEGATFLIMRHGEGGGI